MKKAILKIKKRNFWCVGVLEIHHPSGLVESFSINKHYEVTPDWFMIFDTAGSSGGGFYKGELKRKIFIGDCEFTKQEIWE